MIKLSNVSKYYHNEGIVTLALHKINTEFKLGEFVAITGESGSGKSTLLNVIAGIDTYEEGELYIEGEETSYYDDEDWESYRRDKIAFIFQNYNLIDSYSVLRNVEVSLVIQGLTKKERIEKDKEIINKVGLSSHLKHKASKLSGGQKQRLAIARALAKDTNIIVADEPTGNLDSESSKQILELLNEVSKDKLVFIVTHSYEQAASYVSRKIRLFDGEIVEDKAIKEYREATAVNSEKPKTKEFIQSATIAKLNVFSQPRKSILMFLVSFAIIFFVFLIYSSLKIENRPGYNQHYNDYPERLIVTTKDRSLLTDEDYDFFKEDKRVEKVIKEDSMLDATLSLNNYDNTFYFDGTYLPKLETTQSSLIGRLPENDFEITLNMYYSSSEEDVIKSYINKEMSFNIYNNGVNQVEQSFTFKIVGINKVTGNDRTGYVITDSTLELMHLMFELSNTPNTFYFETDSSKEYAFTRIIIDDDLSGNQVIVQNMVVQNLAKAYLLDEEVEIIKRVDEVGQGMAVYVSKEFLLNSDFLDYNQYTLNLRNTNDRVSLERHLYNNGYYTVSPHYDRNSMEYMDFSIISNIFTSIGLAFIIFIIYLISYLIFRLIMNTKMKDYTILRIIGARKTLISNIIRIELLLSFLFSYILFFISYIFLKNYYSFLDNLRLVDYLVILLINVVLSFLIASRFIKKQVSKTLYSNLRSE